MAEAIEDFTLAIKLQPSLTSAYVHRGILHHQIGSMDIALQDFNLALQQYQNEGKTEKYTSLINLKQKLFYIELSKIA